MLTDNPYRTPDNTDPAPIFRRPTPVQIALAFVLGALLLRLVRGI